MAQQQREENSVLFSLKELRRMEDDRIRQEDDDKRAQIEAARREREEAERRAIEEAEQRRRDDEDRVRRSEEERIAKEREGNLRLAEAERRARVEGEMRIQEERMRLEIQSRKASSPLKAIFAAVGVVVVLAGAVVIKLRSDQQAEREANAARLIQMEQEAARKEAENQRRFQALLDQKSRELAAAKSEDERARIRQEMDQASERERARRARTPRPVAAPAARPAGGVPTINRKRDIADDPLQGLDLK
jgi:colicin import membrane protein